MIGWLSSGTSWVWIYLWKARELTEEGQLLCIVLSDIYGLADDVFIVATFGFVSYRWPPPFQVMTAMTTRPYSPVRSAPERVMGYVTVDIVQYYVFQRAT